MANQEKTLRIKDLLPSHWNAVDVFNEEGLVFLGKKNLSQLLGYWEQEEKKIKRCIKELDEKIDLLDGRTSKNLRNIAKKYRNPNLSKVGVPHSFRDDYDFDDNDTVHGYYLEPLDKRSQSRKRGTTTLNVCGWCKYCYAFKGRYNYVIEGCCQLIPSFLRIGNGDLVKFNTPCVLFKRSEKELNAYATHFKSQKAHALKKAKQIGSYSKYLTKLIERAEHQDQP